MSQAGSWIVGGGPGAVVETLTGNTGGAIPPTGGNINVVGTGNITVTGNPGTSTLTISETSSSAITFDGNTGSANPNGSGIINIVGGNNITTFASGNTVTLNVSGTTNHAVQIGNSTNSLTSLAIGTTGQVLTGVTGSDPVWASPATSSISLTGDTGGALTGNAFTIYANQASRNAGATVLIAGSGTTLTLDVTDGSQNTHMGNGAGGTGSPGNENTSLGQNALHVLNGGNANTAIGYHAAALNGNGSSNVAIGALSLSSYTGTGTANTAVGTNSLSGIVTGDENTALGNNAGDGYTTSDSYNISIGSRAIGVAGESNVLTIGSGTGNISPGNLNKAIICGIDGINVGSVSKVVTMASDQLGTATLTAGANITITPTANTITIAANTGASVINYTGVNHAASPYTVLAADNYISADVTGGVISILLPNAPTTGRVFVVKDKVGLAATSNITVTTVGGAVNIDGATSFVMNTAYESIQLVFNGSTYEVF